MFSKCYTDFLENFSSIASFDILFFKNEITLPSVHCLKKMYIESFSTMM